MKKFIVRFVLGMGNQEMQVTGFCMIYRMNRKDVTYVDYINTIEKILR